MKRKYSNKQRGHSGKMHGDISKRHAKPMDPQDHVAHDLKGLPTQQHSGTELGMEPQQNVMPQTMTGPAEYPGQELGA